MAGEQKRFARFFFYLRNLREAEKKPVILHIKEDEIQMEMNTSENNSSLLSKLWITLRKATCLLRTSWCIILWIKI